MEKAVLWDKEIKKYFINLSEEQLDDFLDLLEYIQTNEIINLICQDVLDDADLWEWLYSKEQIELNDIKRELGKRVRKAQCVDKDDFEQNLDKVGKMDSTKILVLSFAGKNIYYISTIFEYYKGIRCYLSKEKKDEFCKDLQECFPNIYFSEGIEATINTLNRSFEDMREEIVTHLTKINDYQDRFLELLLEHKSYKEIAQEFSANTGIECSPQAKRKSVQSLKEKYYNGETGQEETVICELHTKFDKYNIDRTKQDRIYFFPGKPGIREGRVIVKHIGKHL